MTAAERLFCVLRRLIGNFWSPGTIASRRRPEWWLARDRTHAAAMRTECAQSSSKTNLPPQTGPSSLGPPSMTRTGVARSARELNPWIPWSGIVDFLDPLSWISGEAGRVITSRPLLDLSW